MKRKTTLMPIVIALLVIGFTSCNKYDEGPAFSLKSKKSRLTNTWKIEKLLKNGADHPLSGSNWSVFLEIEIKKDETAMIVAGDIDNGHTQSTTIDSKWEWGDDKKSILFTPTQSFGLYFMPLVATQKKELSIKKLVSDELWLINTESNGNVYEMHFVPK